MGQIVVLAEKPSVGRDIARVVGATERGNGYLTGNGYIVTWAVGHLVALQEPDEIDPRYHRWSRDTLPILPEKIPLKVIQQSRAQFDLVSRLINSDATDQLICATDAGREGELIFRYIYQKAQCSKPFKRLWINSMTDEAIADGFRSIRPGSRYDLLYESAKCRSEADWLVGMNATRAFTLRYDTLLSVGRVQTPTLAILVKRYREIQSFRPEGFATLTCCFGDYDGVWFSDQVDPDTHIKDKPTADTIAAAVIGQPARVAIAETVRKHDAPPQLYDLTSLQRDANRLLGFTADKTLQIAQSLYEKRKALTYPRTDSRYLPYDMEERAAQTLRQLPETYQVLVPGALPQGKLPITKRVFDDTKVTDHHAILPTIQKIHLDSFDADERQLYDLVTRRTIAAFYPSHDYDATRIVTEVGPHRFRTTGKTIISNGWKDVPVLANPPKVRKKAAEEENERTLPPLSVGDSRTVKSTKIKEDTTKPPLPLTDASLLSLMENAGKESEDEEIARQMKGSGIGTPATRAAIIERLIQVGYAVRKGKAISATEKGIMMISVMPEEMTSAELTGRWELALEKISSGQQDPEAFLASIRKFSTFLVQYAEKRSPAVRFEDTERRKKRASALMSEASAMGDVLCPVCQNGHLLETRQSFICSRLSEGCHFTIWKDSLVRGGGPELNRQLMQMVIDRREVKGSTGIITMNEREIDFWPVGSRTPSVRRELLWSKDKAKEKRTAIP